MSTIADLFLAANTVDLLCEQADDATYEWKEEAQLKLGFVGRQVMSDEQLQGKQDFTNLPLTVILKPKSQAAFDMLCIFIDPERKLFKPDKSLLC